MGLEDHFDVFLLPGRKLGEKVACPACLRKGSSWQACPATHFQRATYGKMKSGNDQRGQKQHKQQPKQPSSITSPRRAESGALLTTAVRCKSTMGRGKELGTSWQEGCTEGRKGLEAERAREDNSWPMLSAWHEALKVMALGCSLALKQKPGFQPQFSIFLVMWILLDSKHYSAAVFCGQITPGCSCMFVVRDCK